MDINFLVKLTARAWCLEILAALNEGTAARQAPLLKETGASRGALAQSMDHLIEVELLERNPGHGHPLRPEYRLTEAGTVAARMAGRIANLKMSPKDFVVLRRSWSVPVVTVCQEPKQFGMIRSRLSPISDRALSQSLKQLQEHHWLARRVDVSAQPLRPEYVATEIGAKIGQTVLAAMNA